MHRVNTEVLVVGGGGAGLSAAAAAASYGKKVTIVDENPRFGGQIWRASLAGLNRDAYKLVDQISTRGGEMLPDTTVFDAGDDRAVTALTAGATTEFQYESLIIATGARERFIPFPGWTTPGVFGAGGLQALVKGGFPVAGKKVVVSGTGPLLIAVAKFLKSNGARVIALVEQATTTNLARFLAGLVFHPTKFGAALSHSVSINPWRIYRGDFVTQVNPKGESLELSLNSGLRLECDLLACGFHLVASFELSDLIGCDRSAKSVSVDELQRTSIPRVFAAGETTGIGGIELSVVEGKIAGLAAAGAGRSAEKHFRKRAKLRRFAALLERTFELRPELRSIPGKDTIVCRCEDVAFHELQAAAGWNEAKLRSRCGMGPCQGRICGDSAEFLFDWRRTSVRPPLKPVTMKNLVR